MIKHISFNLYLCQNLLANDMYCFKPGLGLKMKKNYFYNFCIYIIDLTTLYVLFIMRNWKGIMRWVMLFFDGRQFIMSTGDLSCNYIVY